MLRLICILLVVNCLTWISADAQPNHCAIKVDSDFSIENGDRYFIGKIYLKPLGIWDKEALDEMIEMGDIDEYYYKFLIFQIIAEFDPTVFNPFPKNTDFSFTPAVINWEKKYESIIHDVMQYGDNVVMDITYSNPKPAVFTDAKLGLSPDKYTLFGTIKWKLLPTASGTLKLSFRNEEMNDNDGKGLMCDGIALDNGFLTVVFENSNVVEIPIPDDPLAGVDQPKDLAGLDYICGPEQVENYTVTRPGTVDSCVWYLASDALGKNKITDAGVADIVVGTKGENATITWKKTTDKKLYYLCVKSVKGSNESDPLVMAVNVEGFPEFTLPTANITCRQTELTWSPTTGINTFLYLPDYTGGAKTSPYTVLAENKGIYHFVRYRDGNADVCADTIPYTPDILDPLIAWFVPSGVPPVTIDRENEFHAWWEVDESTVPFDSYTKKCVWLSPDGVGEKVSNLTVKATAKSYDFEVYAEINGCKSNTLTAHTEVNGGGILPNASTVGGQNIACKDGGVMLTSAPSGGTEPYSYTWYEKGKSEIKWEGASVWVTPGATTKYYVEVTDANGDTGRDSVEITYKNVATVAVSAGVDQAIVTGTYTYLCGSIASAGASDSYTWNWSPQDMLAGGEQSKQIAQTKNLTADQKYAVYVIDGNGCASKPDSVNVKVFQDIADGGGVPPLTPDDPSENFEMTLSPAQVTLCKNNSVQLSLQTSGINLEGATYSWAPATGLSDATVPDPVLTVTDGMSSAEYMLTVEKGDFRITRKMSVTINSAEAPVLQLAEARMSCTGDVAEVTVVSGTANEYVWMKDGVVAAETGNTYTFADAGKYHLKVYAKQTGSECASDTIRIDTTIGAGVQLAGVSGDVVSCAADTELAFTSVTPSGTTFKWVAPDNTVVSTTDQTITANQTGEYMLVAGTGTCSDTARIQVTLNNVLAAEGLKPLITGCSNTAQLSFASTTATSFVWLDKDRKAIVASKNQNPYEVTEEGYYYLALDGGDCKDTLSVAVKLNYMPVVEVQKVQTTCGNELAINGSASAGTLYWSENADGSSPVTDKVTGNANETKTYYVYADAGEGCISAFTEVTVSFGAKPAVIADAYQTACESPYTLAASTTGTGDVKWYASETSASPISPEVNVSGKVSVDYWVCADDGENCRSERQKVTVQFGVSPQLAVNTLQTTCENQLELQATVTGGKAVWTDMDDKELLLTTVQGNPNDIQYYKVRAVDGSCSTGWEKVEVRFGATPVVLAQSLQTVCGTEHTLVASASAGKLTWYKNSGATEELPSLTVVQQGDQSVSSYYAQAVDGKCKSDIYEVRVAFNTAPVVEVVTPQTTCGNGPLTLSATTTGGSLVWKNSEGNKLPSATVTQAGTYYVYAVDGSGVSACQTAEQMVEVRFGESPKVLVDALQTSCGQTYTLSAQASGGELHWKENGVEVPAFIANEENKGQRTYTVYAQDGSCVSSEESVTVKFNTYPEVTVDPEQTTCETTYQLQASTTGGDLIWKQGSTILSTPQVSGNAGQKIEYTVQAKDNSCLSAVKSVSVIFGSKPTVVVEPLQTACGESYTLQATASEGAQLHWQADGATAESSADVTGSKGETKTYWVWAEKDGCSSDKQQVTVAFGEAPAVKADPVTTCGLSAELVATVTGGSAVWTDQDGTILTDNTVTGSYQGETKTYWVYAQEGSCYSAKQQVTVSFGVTPEVIVDKDITTCGEEYTLSATSTDKKAAIHWLNADQTEEVTVATGSTGSVGTYYVYAMTDASCKSDPVPVKVHFGVAPVLSVVSPQTVCDTIVLLQASATVDNLVWEDKDGKVLASAQVHGPAGSSAEYYVTAVDGACVSAKEAVKVEFGKKPEVIVQPVQTVCPPATEYQLQAQATGGGLVWYQSDNTTVLTNTLVSKVGATAVYYVEAKDGACVSEERTKVTVHFDRAPELTVDKVQTTCGKTISLNASATAGDIVWTTLAGDVLTLPQATDSKGQQQQFYVYAKDGDCESAKALVDVKFGAVPEVTVETLQTACENSHLLTATASDGQIHWLASAGAATDLPSLTVVKGQNPGDTYYVYAENGKDCASDKIPVTVLFGQSPMVSALTPQTSCDGTIQLEASATGGVLVWTDEFGNKLTSTQVSNTTPSAEVVYYVAAVDGTCSSATQKVTAKFNSVPEVIAADKQTTCGNEYTIEATASEGVLHYFSGTTELPSATVNSSGVYKVYAQGSSAACKSAEKEIEVSLGKKPTVTVEQNQSTCEDVLKLEASATGGELFWLKADKTPLLLPQVTKADGISYYVYAAASRDGQECRSAEVPVNVSFGAKPEVTVNTYQTTCSTTYALQATASSGSTLHWLDGETDLGANPTVSGTLNTTAKYQVYATNGSCTSEKVEVTVAFGVAPEVTVAELQTTCINSLTLTASTTAGTLHWRNEAGSKTQEGESWTVTGISNVPQKFYVYAQDGDCKTDEIEVTGNFGVSPAVLAESLQTTCESVYELSGLATEGELHWLYDGQELATNKVSGLPNEVKEYYVYAQKGNDASCKSETQQKVTVVFGATPQVTVLPVQTVCGIEGESTATIQLQASATGGKLMWTDSEGNALASATQTADKNTTKTYYVQAVDATCQSLKHPVEVKFGSAPVVQAETLQTSCGEELALQAQASAGNLVWQKGNIVLTGTTVKKGEGNQYKVYAKDGSCQSDPVEVNVLFNAIPAVSVVSPQTTCGNLMELQASATGGTIVWENAAHEEVKLTQIAGAAGDEATYYVYAKGDGCESAKEMVSVRFGTQPEVIVEPLQTACGEEHVLTATATAGKTVWYASADATTPMASTTVTGSKGSSKEYYVAAEAGENCHSPRQKVTVHFGLPPMVTVDALQTSCENKVALSASATAGVLTWTDATGAKLPTNQVSGKPGENAYYFVTATDGACSSTTERVEVRFGEKPTVIAEEVQTTCGTEYTLQATATDGKLTWYADNGTTKLSSTTVTRPAGSTAEYYVQAGNGSCVGEKQKITVAFGVAPVVTVLTPQTTCHTMITLAAHTTGGELLWTTADGVELAAPVVEANEGETAVYYVQAVDGGCRSLKEEVSVYFGQKPSVNAEAIQTACGSELNLKATATGGEVYWLKADKTVLASTQVKEAATYYVYAADNTCYSDTLAVEAKLGQNPVLSVVTPQTTCGTSLNLLASATGGVVEWTRANGEKIIPAFVEKQDKDSEVFYVKAVDGSCSSAEEAVTVKYNTNPEVIAETLQTSCDTTLTLSGSVSAGNIVWMDSELTPLKSLVVHGQGIQTYYAKARAGGCESGLLKVKVAFNTAPVVNVVTPQTACGTSLNLQASASAGDLIWKEGNTVLTSTLVSMKSGETTATYTVQAKDGKCVSRVKTVDVKFNEKPSLIVQTEQITCGLEYKLQAQATGGPIHWVNSAIEEIPSVIQGNSGETKEVWVYAGDDPSCQSAVTKVTVKFGTAPKVPADVLAQQYTCSTPYDLPMNSAGGHLIWKRGNKELVETTVDLTEGDNVFYVYAEDDQCNPPSSTPLEKVIVTLSGKLELTLGEVHCVGDTLRAEETMGTTGLTFHWTVDGKADAAYTDNYYVFAQGGTYEVSVVAENATGCTSDPVTATLSIAVPVKLDWDIKPQASVAYGSNLNGCVKVISGSTDVKAYNWLSPEKSGFTGKCFNIPAKEEEYLFKVYTTDQYGCVSDTLEATTTVTGFGTLDLTLNSESGNEVCEGGSALLTAVVEGGKAPYTYEWYVKGDATPVRTQTTPSTADIFAVAPDAAVTYVVKVRDAQSTPAIAKEEIALTIKTGVALPVADAGPDMTIQRNLQTILKGGAAGVKEWSWLPVDKLNSAEEAALQYPMTAKLATSQIYQLYVTDNNGCVSLPDEMVVYVLPFDGTEDGIPVPPSGADGLELVVKPEVDTLCLGAERWISVKDLLGNLSAAASYEWIPQTGLTLNAKQDSALFHPATAGDYTFVVMVEDGAKKMALRSNIHVKNGYAPAFDLVVSGNCQNDTVKVVYADGSVSADKLGWKVKGMAISCTDEYYVLSSTGNYTVEVSAENSGCASSAKSVNVSVAASPEITALVLADSCGQAVVEVTATGATAGYTWTATPEGKVDPSAATRYIVEGAGNFEVAVEASNGTCTAKQSLNGEIFSAPRLGDWATEPMDASKNATITAAVVVETGTGTPGYTYHWLQPDAAQAETSGIYNLNPATLASYTFEVYASDAKGCVSDTLNKTIAISGGDVKVDIRSVYGNSICQGGAAMLVAHVQGIEAPCVFEWTKTGQSGYVKAGISNTLKDTVWVEASKVGEYMVNVKKTSTGNILCQAVINTLTVGNKQAPVVTTEPDLTIPSGGHTVLLAEVNNGTPDYNWHWSPANRLAVASDTAVQYPQTAALTEKQVFQVYVTDANSCVSVPAKTTVSINENGLCVSIDPQDQEICRGNTVQMVANVSCGKPTGYDPEYIWLPADKGSLLSAVNKDTVVFTPVDEGKYTWLVKVKNGGIVAVARTYVTVRDADAPVLTLKGNSDCVSDTLKVENSGEAAAKYVWMVDGLESAETGERLVLTDKNIQHVEVYAEAANACRSDLLSRDMKLGVVPVVEIAGGSFVNHPDSVNVIKVKQSEDLTAENYTFAWLCNPIGKINGLTDQLSVKTMPMTEDVKYIFTAISKDNAVCQATDSVWGYMIPQKAKVDIDKDPATGNLFLSWDKNELGLADSVRIMNVKWDGYAVQTSYQPESMVKGDAEKYVIDVSKDTLEFFYINASRYIQEMNKSYYSLASDTVGYMRQWIFNNSSTTQNNFIAYPFDMTDKGITTLGELGSYLKLNAVGHKISDYNLDVDKWQDAQYLAVLGGKWMPANFANSSLMPGKVYKVIPKAKVVLNQEVLLYGKLPGKFVYELPSKKSRWVLVPLSFGKGAKLSEVGNAVSALGVVGSKQEYFIYSTQSFKSLQYLSILGGKWMPANMDITVRPWFPVKITPKNSILNWTK